jgi:zinc protease
MKKIIVVLILLAKVLISDAQIKATYPDIDIPYKKFVLKNGLTLIVHEDHKAPIIAFNIWYHVGSKNEKLGKTGFAHLFEHLMFNGSEHYNKDYFQLMDAIGATDLNGTTNNDRTNYFENFPVSALDKVLWIESDRMGYMVNAIDSGKLNEQRGVVQNEKRQGENQPYSLAEELTTKNTYPAGHPYSWTVIGSMEDLNAASLDDVKDWFKTYYGPNNAIVCIAGDINADSAYEKVVKYFGEIPAGPPISKHNDWVAKMEGTHYQDAQDRVPQSRIQKTWNVPGWGSQDITYLKLLGDILTSGKTSRLYKRMVYDEQIASNVFYYTDDKEIGGQFILIADAKPGFDLSKLDAVINEEMKKVLLQGVSSVELERAKTRYFSEFVKGIERIGGFGGKSDILAQNATYGGSADYYKKINKWVKSATLADIKKVATQWLQDGQYVLNIYPYPEFSNSTSSVDRKDLPASGAAPVVKFPEVKEFTLSNGLKISLVERNAVPVVNMSLMINAGYAADQFGNAGLAMLSGKMLSEGTKSKTSLQISDQLADYGANLDSYSDLDNSYLQLHALKTNIDASLNLFADVLLNPSFPKKDFDRVKQQQLLDIKQEQAQPVGMGLRLLPKILYGSNHAYSNPFTGSGTEESVTKITRDDLIKFHNTWYVPNNSVLVVVGDIKENELKSKLEKSLVAWKSKTVPEKNIQKVPLPTSQSVYIIDKPGALQSIIFAAEVSSSGQDADYEAIKMSNRILGGEFTSRINMNLREGKHWSYGAFSFNLDAKGTGFFTGFAPVQTDKTKESVSELMKEFKQFVTDKPATEEEFKKTQGNAVLQLPGIWETNSSILNTLSKNIAFDRGMKYLENYPSMLQNLKLTDLHEAAKKVVRPSSLTWVIVGDRSKIEKGIRELNIGAVKFLDVNGNEIR